MSDGKLEMKYWFESKTIWIALALGLLNAYFLIATYARPVFESVDSAIPSTPFPLWILLGIDAIIAAGLIYIRKKTFQPII